MQIPRRRLRPPATALRHVTSLSAHSLRQSRCEWFVVDLFENAKQAAAAPEQLQRALESALREARFDRAALAAMAMAARFGSRRTLTLVNQALKATAA